MELSSVVCGRGDIISALTAWKMPIVENLQGSFIRTFKH